MKKITARTIICFLLALLLLAGTLFFTFRFFTKGGQWVSFPSNRHLYTDGVLSRGRILDTEGSVLAAYDGGWQFHDSVSVRKATLHAVGDPAGVIGTGALTQFASKLTGYNPITGADTFFSGGKDLYLTIDADVCAAAYDALNGHKGTVGVYNYKTGEIICMVSAPAYDPADPPVIEDGDETYDGVYINRLISSTFTPGSTFKLITAAAALDNISDIHQRTFECSGSTKVGQTTVTCVRAHGTLTFEDALNVSCNGAFAQLAVEMGSSVMEEYVDKTGLTDKYSINGIRTAASSFDFEADGETGLAWSGVGQGKDLVNPCALMIFCGAAANGGKAAVPQIIDHTAFHEGVRTSLYIKHSTDQLLNESTADTLKSMMKSDVENNYGSGNFPGLDIGAKSGTAEVDKSKASNAWFTGFLDDEDHPLSFVVMVEGGGSGAATAGRVANTVLQEAVKKGY